MSDEAFREGVPQGPPTPEPPKARSRRPRDDGDEDAGDNAVASIVPYTNPPALIGYYLGVFGLIPCLGLLLGPAAIVAGILGLNRVNAEPRSKGKGHAITALVLGIVTSLLNYGALVFFLFGAVLSRR